MLDCESYSRQVEALPAMAGPMSEGAVFDTLHPIGVACRVAGIQRHTVLSWIKRDYAVLREEADVRSPGQGRAAQLSGESILQLTITGELWRRGVAPRDALLAALQATSIGTESFGSRGAPTGQTFGIYRPEHGLEILRHSDGDPMDLPAIFGGEQSLVVLDLLEIYRHVVRELGRDQEGDA